MKRFLPIALIAVGSIVAAPQSGSEHFRSERYGYSAAYPPGWHQLSPKRDSLDIINFPDSQRRAGIVIPPSGAELMAGPSPYPAASLEQWIQSDLQGQKPEVDRIVATGTRNPEACSVFREVKYLDNINPSAHPYYMNWTVFYCADEGRHFAVSLDYFPENSAAKDLDEVALGVAKSIRFFSPGGNLK